jgi:hypothetical protein
MISYDDVAALSQLIDIEQELAALDWFIKEHTTFPEDLRRFFLDLAKLVAFKLFLET